MNRSISLLHWMRIGSTLRWMGELLGKMIAPTTQIQMRILIISIIDCMKYQHCDATTLLSHSGVYLLRYIIYHIMMAYMM